MKYYLTNLGYAVGVTESEGWCGRQMLKLFEPTTGESLHLLVTKGGTSTTLFVNTSKEVDPKDFPTAKSVADNFEAKYGNKSCYLQGKDGLFHMFEVHTSGKTGSLCYYSSGGDVWERIFPGASGITLDNRERSHFPYEDIKFGADPVGILDFTYGDLIIAEKVALYDFFKDNLEGSKVAIQLFEPKPSHKFPGKITVYMNKKDKDRDRLTALRPGRAFKLMFPHLSDMLVAKLVDIFNKEFPPLNLSVLEGTEEEHFIKAYQYEQATMQNVHTTSSRKSLANSCMRMRPEFEGLPKHPAAAYASGDFLSIWVEDEGGRIAARCVVYVNEDGVHNAGPVYGTSEASIDMVEERLKALGAITGSKASWEGARLLYIPCQGGTLAPYLDLERGLKIQGSYLRISDSGSYADFVADSYGGILGGGRSCEGCDERLHEDDVYENNDGEYFCECCYHDRYGFCDIDGEEYPRDELEHVRESRSRWGWETQRVYDPESHGYVLIGDYWYNPDLVVTTEEGDQHLEDSGNYFFCEQTDLCHNISEAVEAVVDGHNQAVSLAWVNENGYTLGKDGVYTKEEKEAA